MVMSVTERVKALSPGVGSLLPQGESNTMCSMWPSLTNNMATVQYHLFQTLLAKITMLVYTSTLVHTRAISTLTMQSVLLSLVTSKIYASSCRQSKQNIHVPPWGFQGNLLLP